MTRQWQWKIFDDVKNFNINENWKKLWNEASVYGNEIIKDPTKKVNGTKLERSTWVTLNRIRTHQGKCGSCLFKWSITESPCCDCGALDQTIAHILRCFVIYDISM